MSLTISTEQSRLTTSVFQLCTFGIMDNLSVVTNKTDLTFNILAIPPVEAYFFVAIYVVVILLASFGSVLIIIAVTRTKTNIYIGMKVAAC